MLKPRSKPKHDLINIEEAARRFENRKYKHPLNRYLPDIPNMWCVPFTLKRALKLARLYCKMSDKAKINNVVWSDLEDGVGAHTYCDLTDHITIIHMNKLYKHRGDCFMWELFAHEVAHIRQHNHSKHGFGVEVMRVTDFFRKYGNA
jgi:hypothetical protein